MIDLKICQNGDILLTNKNSVLEYTSYDQNCVFPHSVIYLSMDGKTFNRNKNTCPHGSRTDEGFVSNKRFDGDHEVIKIIRPSKANYYIQNNVGKAKYVLSLHDGITTHKDGSPFYDINLYSNKTLLNRHINLLKKINVKEK